ncbi:MAG: tRNA (guanine-N1)-methyltransferase [Thermoprotei archaeon]|nr:tRNA (guanine-N1)-methyltransferase [Thermoprotei archaeon]
MKTAFTERPAIALLEILANKGVYRVGYRPFLDVKKASASKFQHVAVEMLVNEYNMVYDYTFTGNVVAEESYKGFKFRLLTPEGNVRADASISYKSQPYKVSVSWKEVSDLLPTPPFPLFVVDMGIAAIQSYEDSVTLRVQIEESLQKIREYLWDPHLAVTSSDKTMAEWLYNVAGKNKAIVTQSRPSELLWSTDADKVIIIRQDAPHPLTPNDILTSEAFLIGFQEKIPRPGLGKILDNLVPWGLPRRVELAGSTAGVPYRVNKIIEMILKARYAYEGNVEKAILSSMTKKDVLSRLYFEITRRAQRDHRGEYVTWDSYYEISKWLNVSRDEFLKVAEKAKIEVR